MLITKYKNQKFDTGGWFGELHPQALMYLAELETDRFKAIGIYQEVISRFPRSWTGRSHTCDVSLYLSWAMDNMLALAKDDRHKQKLLWEIANSDIDSFAKGMALLELGKFHRGKGHLKKAVKIYKLAAKRYKNVEIGLYKGTIGGVAQDEVETLEVRMELGE